MLLFDCGQKEFFVNNFVDKPFTSVSNYYKLLCCNVSRETNFRMAGLYIHIPFCFSQCGYCDFFKTTKLDGTSAFLNSLKQEIALKSTSFPYPIQTIYFGGGTPSLIKSEYLKDILILLQQYYNVNTNCEITIECNPDDLSKIYLDEILAVGFNRLSIGIQSFNDSDLKIMGRRHNAAQAFATIDDSKKAGFTNIGVDFIYGLPWSNLDSFTSNLKTFANLDVQHISAYCLSIEKGTAFFAKMEKGLVHELDDSKSLDQYNMLCHEFNKSGFEHYEVSNFCRKGFYSQHNSAYWKGIPYLGFGPGSHSYKQGVRFWNKPDIKLYYEGNLGLLERMETLTKLDSYNEMIMLGLRTIWGVNIEVCKIQFPEYFSHFMLKMNKYCNNGLLFQNGENLKCYEKSWFMVDGIIEDFMLTKD